MPPDPSLRIGIVGGGQLGRMLTLAAHPLGLAVTVLDPTPGCPAAQVGAAQIVGALHDPAAIRALAEQVDVVTWEVEHIAADALVDLEAQGHVVRPSPRMLAAVQDKLAQKRLVAAAGVEVPAHREFPSKPNPAALEELFATLGRPVIVKARYGGFDGRGNAIFDGDLEALAGALGDNWGDFYAEQLVPFDSEVAVVVARGASGCADYPIIRTTQCDGVCNTAVVPAGVASAVEAAARHTARRVLGALDGWGVFAVELFVAGDSVLFNEVAPRVHNSGHLTIEASTTSQFEQHLRAVAGLPLGRVETLAPAAAMVNILGRREDAPTTGSLAGALAVGGAHVHLYGKASRQGRKIGHVTALGSHAAEALDVATRAREALAL